MSRSTSVRRFFGVALAIVVLVRGAAWADQTSSGVVYVEVTAPPGADTRVEIAADGGPARSWTVALTGAGRATIHRLPPGAFILTVESPGAALSRLPFSIHAAETVSFAAAAGGDGQAPRIVLVGRGDLGQVLRFDMSRMRDFPVETSLTGTLDTAEPFLILDRMDPGGLATATFARVSGRGASWTAATLSFGDIQAGAPEPNGAWPLYPDLGAVDSVVVTEGLGPTDIGSPGASITLVPKRPGSALHGAVDASFSTDGMNARRQQIETPAIGRVQSWRNVGVQIGGPVKSRVGLFVSGASSRVRFEEREAPLLSSSNASSLFTHLVAGPTDRDEVRVIAAVQRLRHAFDGRLQFRDPTVWEHDTFVQSRATWDHQTRSGAQRELSIGLERGAFTPSVTSALGGTVDRVFDGPVPSAPASSVRTQWDARFEFDPAQRPKGGALRLVVALNHTSASLNTLAAPSVAELVGGLPARVWSSQLPAAPSARHVTDISATASESMPFSPHFTLDLGVRANVQSGAAKGAAQGITWVTVSPRAAFRWTPKVLTIFGGYRRYHRSLTTDLLAFGDPGSPAIDVFRWNDANGNGQLDANETGVLVARAGRNPGIASIDPGIRPTTTDEYALSGERRLGRAMFLRGTIAIRNERSLLRSVNTGVTAAGYTVVLVPDGDTSNPRRDGLVGVYDRLPATFGKDQFVLTNAPQDVAYFGAVEALWGLTTPRWYSQIGAMMYRTEGSGGNRGFAPDENDQGVIGEHLENPNAAVFSNGRLFFDRSYVLKWLTSYKAKHDWVIGVGARYQDGQPFSRMVIAPNLAQGPEVVSADRPGHTRFTYTITLDTRIEKSFAVGKHRAAVRVDLYNFVSRANEVEENPLAGPAFRNTTAVQPPRAVRLGFRMEF